MYNVSSDNKTIPAVSIEHARHLCAGKISATISKDHDIKSDVPDNFIEYWEYGKRITNKIETTLQMVVATKLRDLANAVAKEEHPAVIIAKLKTMSDYLNKLQEKIQEGKEEEVIDLLK